MDTIFNGVSRRRKVGSPDAYDERDFAIGEPAFKLSPGEAMGFGYAPGRIGHRQLKDALGQVNGNGSGMHDGLLLLKTDPHPHEHRWR